MQEAMHANNASYNACRRSVYIYMKLEHAWRSYSIMTSFKSTSPVLSIPITRDFVFVTC